MSNTNPEERPSSSSTPPPEFQKASKEMIKACENLTAISFHNPKEAISQVNELCSKHDNVPFVHYTRGQVLKLYSTNLHESDKNKIKHLRDAINSLQRAVDLFPQSPLYSHGLAEGFLLLAKLNHADYHIVVQECERALGEIPRMDPKQRDNHEKLILAAKAAQEKDNFNRIGNIGRVDQKNTKENTELDIRKNDRKLERSRDFIRKTGEYWRELSYDEKCRILDVKVKDVESFYRSWKNLKASSVLTEAIDMCREKSHWFTWTCCFCKEDRKNEDFDVWRSIEKHIDNHFDDPEPRLKGTFNYDRVGNSDSLDIRNGFFVLHNVLDERMLTKETCNAPIQNNKFLSQWLTNEHGVELQLDLWEKRRDRPSGSASMIYEEIVKLKEKQAAAHDMHTVLSDEIRKFEEKIITLKRRAVWLSVKDYREIIVPLLKSFIRARLECEVEKEAREGADAKMLELIKDDNPKNKKKRPNNRSPTQEGSEPQMQHEIQAYEAEEIASEAVEHPPENVDDANDGWVVITRKNKGKDVDAEQ